MLSLQTEIQIVAENETKYLLTNYYKLQQPTATKFINRKAELRPLAAAEYHIFDCFVIHNYNYSS
jgi:hypothetical protein